MMLLRFFRKGIDMGNKYICEIASAMGERMLNQDNFVLNSITVGFNTPYLWQRVVIDAQGQWNFAAVADGVTNSANGGFCAELIAKAFCEMYRNGEFIIEGNYNKKYLDKLVTKVNQSVYREFKEKHLYGHGAATLSVVLFNDNKIYSYNLGDSPVHLIRNSKMISIFEEHTVAAQKKRKRDKLKLVEQNMDFDTIREEERNRITKCVHGNLNETMDGFFEESEFKFKDIVLISSDGLLKAVKEQRVVEILQNEFSAKLLVDEAINNGCEDNVTIIAIKKQEVQNNETV